METCSLIREQCYSILITPKHCSLALLAERVLWMRSTCRGSQADKLCLIPLPSDGTWAESDQRWHQSGSNRVRGDLMRSLSRGQSQGPGTDSAALRNAWSIRCRTWCGFMGRSPGCPDLQRPICFLGVLSLVQLDKRQMETGWGYSVQIWA